ncbi:uncharacterized protein KIAA0754-like [Brachypodium distachyon]|uniref:uncharacterized protein KIAA0754-like n=1 Tax=Brachypodium distachyon TaxID=15368 RepID=UPI00052FECED|nr:uncharacterized protein KIAA0754-like [Brachypodium distachyon]|eukprot:XP_010229546.1 uncharacterized protein KIAA0754-like [Brachypodium distachyon]
MALSARRMPTMPLTEQPALPAVVSPGCGLSPDEECLAVSLLMLSRGVREDPPLAFLADDVAEPPAPAAPLVAHQAAPAAAVASQAPAASVDVVAPSPPSTPVVAAARASVGRDEVILTVQSPSPVLAPADMVTTTTPSLTPRQQVPPSPAVAVGPNNVLPAEQEVVTEEEQALAAEIQAPEQQETLAVGSSSSSRGRQQPPRHECGVCRKTFSTSRGLKVHVTSHPDRGRLYPCEFCAAVFPSSSALRWHVRRSQACGGSKPRKLRAAAAAAIAWHRMDLNDMPEV